MAWLKLDDQIFLNRKIARCDPETKLLYIVGLTYCANQLTDGEIPEDVLPLLAGMAGIDKQIAKQSVSKLLDVCLWVASPFGWQIPDYLEYNPSREQVEHNRMVRSEAGKRGGMAKPSKTEAKAKQIAKQNSKQNASKSEPPSPSPSPSDRDEGIARPPVVIDNPIPENDPEFEVAISKLEHARIGSMNGSALLELSALWPDLTNGRRAWLDDAIRVAQASKASTPVYALRVLANAIRKNERPGQVPEHKPSRNAGHTVADLDAIFGVDIHGNPV